MHRQRDGDGERDRESGASAIELVLLTPLLFLLMFLLVETGLVLFARHVAFSAAQEGDRQARETAYADPTTWVGSSTQYASNWAQYLLGGVISGGVTSTGTGPQSAQQFALTRDPEVQINITFGIYQLLPGVNMAVSGQAKGPVECAYSQTGYCVG